MSQTEYENGISGHALSPHYLGAMIEVPEFLVDLGPGFSFQVSVREEGGMDMRAGVSPELTSGTAQVGAPKYLRCRLGARSGQQGPPLPLWEPSGHGRGKRPQCL